MSCCSTGGGKFFDEKAAQSVQEVLDHEIAVHEECIRAIRTRRNAVALICKLPPEILSRMFEFLAGTLYRDGSIYWVRVSHVCQHWRRVALDFPRLWSYIDCNQPKWAMEMLSRSKSSLVSLKCGSGSFSYLSNTPDVVRALEAGLGQLNRLQELYILLPPLPDVERILSHLCAPAPNLRSFHLENFSSLLALPEGIFSGYSPHLHTMELKNWKFNWDASIIASLSTLKVSYVGASLVPAHVIFASLAKMSQVEVLELSGAIDDHGPECNSQVIQLPCLTRLLIQSVSFQTSLLFKAISCPKLMALKFSCSAEEPSNDYSGILHLCSQLDKSVFLARRLSIASGGAHIQITAGDSNNYVSLGRPSFDISIAAHYRLFSQIGIQLCETLPFRDLVSLSVTGYYLFTQNDWTRIFCVLNTLEEIQTDCPETLIAALSIPLDKGGKEENMCSIFHLPTLRKLTIEDCDFGGDNSVIDQLTDCLRKRRENGCELEELVLRECRHITEDDISGFEEYTDVVWDGETYEDSQTEEEDSDDHYGDYCHYCEACSW